ncbi:hypothetical protein [Chryseobacterium sp.]|uniref:hypothetical protein n=1 Tax=Chryseobacterium sp. TaxID=1871047 RepID=UPI00289F2B11|nr:hypothetical protein [Chryseobacterium sp.]
MTDPQKRTFIYHIFDDAAGTRLEIACVKKGKTANEVAIERGFVNSDGYPEWYFPTEHPCIYENEIKSI